MKTKIFIDANIYLTYYKMTSLSGKTIKTIEGLEELAKEGILFIPKQIQREVRRNSLRATLESINGNQSAKNLKNIKPEVLFKTIENSDQRKDLIDNINKHKRSQLEEEGRRISEVSNGTDQVSMILDKLWSYAKEHTLEQLEKARWLKEVGEPPGKKSDPLGDQLSWVQFVDECSDVSEVIIVTRDSDYWYEHDRRHYLHPALKDALPGIITHVFETLPKGYDKILSTLPVESALDVTSDDLIDLSIEEERQLRRNNQKAAQDYFDRSSNVGNRYDRIAAALSGYDITLTGLGVPPDSFAGIGDMPDTVAEMVARNSNVLAGIGDMPDMAAEMIARNINVLAGIGDMPGIAAEMLASYRSALASIEAMSDIIQPAPFALRPRSESRESEEE